MKKVVSITWHTLYNLLGKVKNDFNLANYSSQLIDDEVQDINKLYEDIDSADLVICYISPSGNCWTEIEEKLKEVKCPIVYLGSECRATSKEDIEICAMCNTYMSYSGENNLRNLVKYALNKTGVEDVVYDEPEKLPWEGIFHPDTKEYFTSLKDYFNFKPKSSKGTIGILTSRNYWINENIEPETQIIKTLEDMGYSVLPVFSYSIKDKDLGANGCEYAVEEFMFDEDGQPVVDALVKMTSFFLNAQRRSESKKEAHSTDILSRLNCPVIKPIVSGSMTIEEWENSEDGASKDVAWSVALPELEGVVDPIFIGGIARKEDNEQRVGVETRIQKLANRLTKWIALKKKENKDKKVVIMLNNSPCAGAEASVGGGANLDALESVARLLHKLKDEGYDIENPPADGKELIDLIMSRKAISEFRWTTVNEIVDKGGALDFVTKEEYAQWFSAIPEDAQQKVIKSWGRSIGETVDGIPPSMVYKDKLVISGVSFKNAVVCVQPKRGCAGSKCDGVVCKILHDPHCPPTHQFIATYKYFEHKYGADAFIHVGTHGSLEFLPGKSVGLSDSCFPDICAGNLPCFYIYNSDNPPEGTMAKRRGLATIIDHMQTVMTDTGLYEELEELDTLLAKYDQLQMSDKTQAHLLEHMVKEEIEKCNLDKQINLENYHEDFESIVEQAHTILTQIKGGMIQSGQHILGEIPQGKDLVDFLFAILRYEGIGTESIRTMVCRLVGLELTELLANKEKINAKYLRNNGSVLYDIDNICKDIIQSFIDGKEVDETIKLYDYTIEDASALNDINGQKERVLDIRDRINQSTEIDSVVSALNGNFIPAGAAGVITRGRDDVLPTGRNFFTLDPNTIPTKMAYEVGRRLGNSVIEKFFDESGDYPTSFAMYWMANDIMWADGEGMAQLMYMIGTRPKWLPNGKVVGFEIIPLEELGRPRIDVTIKLSGILRDSFFSCVEILDEAITAVAALDEPLDMNFVRKHTLENMKDGMPFETASSRIFAAKPGTYTTGVNLAVYASAWKDQKDFVDMFTFYNGYSYGKNKYGKEDFTALQNGLRNVDITYNKVVSDEHDLLGCCCYFGNHGAMTAAARELSNKEVKTYYGDTREVNNVEIRTLADEIRRVVRSKLLNPKWIEGQKEHGYKGAMDISKKIGRVYGWEATTSEVDDWIFDDITKTFVTNEENRQFFMENNPWALEEMERRLIEAYERKMWEPEEGLIEQIKDSYLEIEGFMEEDMGDSKGNYQGGGIDIVDLNEIDIYKNNIHAMKAKLKK